MPRIDSTGATLFISILVASAIGLGVAKWSTKPHAEAINTITPTTPVETSSAPAAVTQASEPQKQPRQAWTAAAAGRVEPKGGEVRIGAQLPGKVADVLVRINDEVKAGDLLVRLQDDDAAARLHAANAEAAVRRRDRDGETVGGRASERRTAEDTVAAAERALHDGRIELDRILLGRAAGSTTPEDLDKARATVRDASQKLEQDRANLRRVVATQNMPLATRLEAALAAARADLLLAEIAVERTRIRAPTDGTVLQVLARVGETAVPSSENALILFGDVSSLRVRAEVEERDANKVRAGQAVVVRSDAFPGRDFAGSVDRTAQALAAPRLAARGPRKPSDVDVLDVLIELEGRSPLLPGMRVDVFFKTDATARSGAGSRAN